MELIKQLSISDLDQYIEHLARHLPEPGVDGIYSQPFLHNKPIEKDNFKKTVSTRWLHAPGEKKWEVAWGLFSNEKIVGHLELIGSGFPATSHRAKLGMGIESAFRNQGFGKKLLSAAIAWAKEQSFLDYIDLDVFAHNQVAIKMYDDFGFKQIGRTQDHVRIDNQVIDDLQYSLNLNSGFPADFKFEICDRERFYSVVGELTKTLFAIDNLCAWTEDFISEFEKAKLADLNSNYSQNFTLYTLLFHNEELAGWSMGFQTSRDVFLIANSAVLPKFRGKSLYSVMQDEILKILVAKGFQRIQSYHLLTNNKIILSKLKKGFVITGMNVNELTGVLVQLTYFCTQLRKEIMDFRVGQKMPTQEIKSIFKI